MRSEFHFPIKFVPFNLVYFYETREIITLWNIKILIHLEAFIKL